MGATRIPKICLFTQFQRLISNIKIVASWRGLNRWVNHNSTTIMSSSSRSRLSRIQILIRSIVLRLMLAHPCTNLMEALPKKNNNSEFHSMRTTNNSKINISWNNRQVRRSISRSLVGKSQGWGRQLNLIRRFYWVCLYHPRTKRGPYHFLSLRVNNNRKSNRENNQEGYTETTRRKACKSNDMDQLKEDRFRRR